MTNPPTDKRGVTDEMVREWAERHDIFNSGSGGHLTDALAAFDDAQSQAALSHQGDVVKVSELDKLARKWDAKSVRDYGQKSSHAGDLRKLLVANGVTYVTGGDLTALISKAEKV